MPDEALTEFVTIKAIASGGNSVEAVIEIVYSERPQSLIFFAEFTEDVTGLSFDFTFAAGTFENQALALPSVSFGTITIQLGENSDEKALEMFSITGLQLLADGYSVFEEYISLHPENDRMDQLYDVFIELLNSDGEVNTVTLATINLIVEAVEEITPNTLNEESDTVDDLTTESEQEPNDENTNNSNEESDMVDN
jgi:hypothetical protein